MHNIHIQNDFQNILSAVGTAPLRCILIDGLERAIDEDRKRVLNDLIIAIRSYNESALAKGGHKDYCWKIVFTSRKLEAKNILIHLETRKHIADNTLKIVEVGLLDSEEVKEVVTQLPKLKELASQGRLKEFLSRPLILDILTLPDISLPPEKVPPLLTEAWLLDWFWKEVVRLAEGVRPGIGNPDKREQLLIHIADESLIDDNYVSVSDNIDLEAVSGLVSDRILNRENNNIRFSHDVYKDWTLVFLIEHHKGDISKFLIEKDESCRLIRAFRLFASRILEVEQSPSAWLDLLTMLESESNLSPRWYQIALTSPLFSPLLSGTLSEIQSNLFANDGILLGNFLKALRTICVQPDPTAYKLFGDLPPAELEKYLAYMTIPIWNQWIPVIQLILQNSDKLSDNMILEFSYIAEKWMTKTAGDQLFRKNIAELCLNLLNKRFLRRDLKSSLKYEGAEQVRKNLVKSVLWAADCLPDPVDDFVKQKALRGKKDGNYGFEELILEEGWMPLCKYLPKTAVNIIEAILCEEIKPDRFGSYHHLFIDLGITFTSWHPPTYLKGPFLGLLRLHADEGLELVHRVTNHATRCWKLREELESCRKAIQQTIKLQNSDIEVWGDEHVYNWYRFPSVAPATVTCALMALEYWMNQQIKSEIDSRELFEKVLQGTKSAAVVGVCSSVALTNWKLCPKVIIPILENPAFWIMDVYRFTQDMTAESSVNMFSFAYNNADYKILLKLSKQSHRKLDIRSFVLPILLSSSERDRERLQEAMRSFPDNPPFFFEDEKKNNNLIKERVETCKIWAAQAERENYEVVETGVEGRIGIQFKLQAELEKEQEDELKLLEAKNKLYRFQGWSMNLLNDGEVGQAFTIESAMQYAQDLVRQDDPSYKPKNFIEDSEQRAWAIAAFAAALVLHQWQWVEKNNYVSLCREQLLIAAERPEPPAEYHDDVTLFSMGYRRSAARALPIFFTKYPKDKRIRKAILPLSSHKNNEVRDYLFKGLNELWAIDQRIIWKCINAAIKYSRKKALDQKFWYLNEQTRVSVDWRDFGNIKKLTERAKKIGLSIFVQYYPKSIKSCSHSEIDTRYLQSVLYCLPFNNQIISIPSSNKLVDFLEELLLFTLNVYIQFEKEDKQYMWAYNEWNQRFFPIIANAVLRLPKNVVEPKLYEPIVNNWEKAPSMMERFLRGLLLVGPQPELEDRFVEIWFNVGDKVLSLDKCKTKGYYLNEETRNILGLIIFADPQGIVTWKVQEWALLKKMIVFIGRWCDTVGDNPECFSSLVRLLKTIGFALIPEYGINWLYNCISKVENPKKFFERTRISSLLAELLYDSWSKQEQFIKQNPKTLKRFVFLVDLLAEQGESIAVLHQAKLQGKISDR